MEIFIIIFSVIIIFSIVSEIIAFVGKRKDADVISVAIRLKKSWLLTAVLWFIVDCTLTIVSFASSIVTVYIASNENLSENDNQNIILFSILSAILVVANFLLNPKKQTRAYRKAFEKIDFEINIYNNDNVRYDKTNMINLIKKCEKEIGKTFYS